MTLEDLKLRLEKQFLGLSNEVNVPDDEVLQAMLDEGVAFVSEGLTLDINKEKILLPLYVASKLLERKGYVELAEKYWNKFMQIYNMFRKVYPKDETPTSVDYASNERVFTDDELEKW